MEDTVKTESVNEKKTAETIDVNIISEQAEHDGASAGTVSDQKSPTYRKPIKPLEIKNLINSSTNEMIDRPGILAA